MKQFYIIMSTLGALVAMDNIYTGEFPPSCRGGVEEQLTVLSREREKG
jgi:hypothetical protein